MTEKILKNIYKNVVNHSSKNPQLTFLLIKIEGMTDLYLSSSSVSPLTAILWCLYPIAVLVIVELLLGGGFDDDNDDQDGGMLIPAYSRPNA